MAPQEFTPERQAKPEGSEATATLKHKHMYELTTQYNPTYDKNRKMISEKARREHLNYSIKYLKAQGIVFLDLKWEKTHCLHYHALVKAPRRLWPYPKLALYSFKFSQKWKKLGLGGWLTYIRKEEKKRLTERDLIRQYQTYRFNEI